MKRNPLWAMLPFILAWIAAVHAPSTWANERRIALVIGNANYSASPLKNPINDVNDMANALWQCGFNVTKVIDADRKLMRQAIRSFGVKLQKGGVGLFYYAGHGIQVDGENYLVPIGAKVYVEDEVRDECLLVSSVLRKMDVAGNSLNIIILDACRDNPFARSFRSSNKGLAKMDAPTGSILAYATAPGSIATEGLGRNGLYTSMLLKHMAAPGLEIGLLFRKVRVDVLKATQNKQVPWEASSLTGQFYFVPNRGVTVSALPENKPPVEFSGGLTPPVTIQRKFKNPIGMEFVYISPGIFTIGSPSGERGRDGDETQARVSLSQGYYMQSTEVTQGQWQAVMGNNPSRFTSCGDRCPVENVSWRDVQRFVEKLNRLEGDNKYRLPTEAQWEYACRADSSSSFSYGDNDDQLGLYAWFKGNSGGRIHPVAQKKPNAWGLYDMHGNVWEWCRDKYGKYMTGATTDPVGPTSGSSRVYRGGGWNYSAGAVRCANRVGSNPGYRYSGLGFRLVREP